MTADSKPQEGKLKKRIGLVKYYKNELLHWLDDKLVSVDCGKKFEHEEVEKVEGEIMKAAMRVAFPHPNRVYPEQLTVHEIKQIVDEAAKEFPAKINKDQYGYQLTGKTDVFEHSPETEEKIAKWFLKWFGSGGSE